jgi:hypothetical protein
MKYYSSACNSVQFFTQRDRMSQECLVKNGLQTKQTLDPAPFVDQNFMYGDSVPASEENLPLNHYGSDNGREFELSDPFTQLVLFREIIYIPKPENVCQMVYEAYPGALHRETLLIFSPETGSRLCGHRRELPMTIRNEQCIAAIPDANNTCTFSLEGTISFVTQ